MCAGVSGRRVWWAAPAGLHSAWPVTAHQPRFLSLPAKISDLTLQASDCVRSCSAGNFFTTDPRGTGPSSSSCCRHPYPPFLPPPRPQQMASPPPRSSGSGGSLLPSQETGSVHHPPQSVFSFLPFAPSCRLLNTLRFLLYPTCPSGFGVIAPRPLHSHISYRCGLFLLFPFQCQTLSLTLFSLEFPPIIPRSRITSTLLSQTPFTFQPVSYLTFRQQLILLITPSFKHLLTCPHDTVLY